jgi:nucleoside-diphosphate-sugar epimerase
MRILVAGGAGFIGSHLCERLLDEGHTVFCVDNFSTGNRANLEQVEGRDRFEMIEADVESAPSVPADLVLHLASPASPVQYAKHPIETLSANSAGSKRLLEISEANGARFIFASTSEVYGDPEIHPQDESYWGHVNPVGPRACYDEGKRFGEALTMSFRRQRNVNVSIVRFFNTYGPRMDPADGRVVPSFIGSALSGEPLGVHGEGQQTRAFCYVSDLIEGLLLVAFDHSADGEIFNIGNPHEVTMLQLAHAVMQAAGNGAGIVFLPRPEDDPGRRCPDIHRIQQRYGWTPKVSLAEGLRRTVGYFADKLAEPQTTRMSN